MKKLAVLLLTLLLMTSVSISYAENDAVGLRLDGKVISSDTPAVIVSERTLVPARAVFEAMGGNVAWDEPLREVTVTLGRSVVKLVIDSKTAYVDGEAITMDVAASIISERTLIPVRFVAEAFGYEVKWDEPSRMVDLISPQSSQTGLRITGIDFSETEEGYQVRIIGSKSIAEYDDFVMNNPDRLVLDLADSTLGQVERPAITTNDRIQGIRFSQFDKETVRVVVDLKKVSPASVGLSDDQKSLIVLFSKSGEPIDEPTGEMPVLIQEAKSKLIVIDAGHGGKDPGAIGYSNGQSVLYEKEVNLDVALRINGLLQEQGANVYMMRSQDTAISLLERPAMANALNADLYISIHNNSSDNAAMRGFEVLYYNKSSETTYSIASSDFADLAQTALVRELGMAFKTPQERPTLAVLNKTVMPAIIIEGAFLSNPEDLALIMTEVYRVNYARAAATAIILALNESVD